MSKKLKGNQNNTVVEDKVVKVVPKNEEQREALKAIDENVVTFIDGDAGTGKSHIAVAYGLQMLLRGKFSKIILTRPCVAAGEDIGLLPGSIREKTDIYLLPIYDILRKYITDEQIESLIERGKILPLPIGFMRGYTMDGAYAILDEAQNATFKQLQLFLTRIGEGSKVVITGDVTQSDIKNSGLEDMMDLLEGAKDIACVELTEASVVRHPVIIEIERRIRNRNSKNETPIVCRLSGFQGTQQ